jgi:hypothetical protein
MPMPLFDSGVQLQPADHLRLGKQLDRIHAIVSDGQWYSVPDVRIAIQRRFGVQDPEPSISAQLRNLRKAKFGGLTIERRRVGNFWEFRCVEVTPHAV